MNNNKCWVFYIWQTQKDANRNDKEHNLHMRKREREAWNIQHQEEEHWEVYTSEIQYLPET